MLAALTASAHGFSSTPKTPSGCPEDLFGYVDPYTMAVVDSSVDPLVLADNFGFGPAGGDFLYTATKAAVLHYLPFRSAVPNATETLTETFSAAPGITGDGTCLRPGPPGCGQYVKTTYETGCPFLGPDADLILGAMSNENEGLNEDFTFTGCTAVAQETHCFMGFSEEGFAIKVDCSVCEAERRKLASKEAVPLSKYHPLA